MGNYIGSSDAVGEVQPEPILDSDRGEHDAIAVWDNMKKLSSARGGLRTHDLRISQVRGVGTASGMRLVPHGLVTL